MRLDGVELLSEFSAFLAVFFWGASTCRESLLDNWSSTLRDIHLDQEVTVWPRNIRAAYVYLNKFINKITIIENPGITVSAWHVTWLNPDTDHCKKSFDPSSPHLQEKKDKSSTVMFLPVYLLFPAAAVFFFFLNLSHLLPFTG